MLLGCYVAFLSWLVIAVLGSGIEKFVVPGCSDPVSGLGLQISCYFSIPGIDAYGRYIWTAGSDWLTVKIQLIVHDKEYDFSVHEIIYLLDGENCYLLPFSIEKVLFWWFFCNPKITGLGRFQSRDLGLKVLHSSPTELRSLVVYCNLDYRHYNFF